MRGNAVAITNTKALTALHGNAEVGAEVELVDIRGVRRIGTIIFLKLFEMYLVDIALIQLRSDQPAFLTFVPVCRGRVKLLRSIYVIGLAPSLDNRDTALYCAAGEVTFIEPNANSSLFRSTCQS